MRKYVSAAMLLTLGSSLYASCDNLFISEYIEGSSYNKAIELYNPTASDIDLSSYSVELFSNGSATPTGSMTLSGTIAAGSTYVLANASAAAEVLAVADVTNSSVINFNGDDAFTLSQNGAVIDAIGQVGVDPGTSWSGDFKDETMLRLSSVTQGDSVETDVFDPSIEWTALPKDTFTNLGTHSVDGCSNTSSSSSEMSSSSSSESSSSSSSAPAFDLIHDIQGTDDISAMNGADVTVEAVVVGKFDGLKGYFIQEEDDDADNNPLTSEGIFVYCASTACSSVAVNIGDTVQISGTVGEFYHNTQISSITSVTDLGIANAMPTPATVQLPVSDVNAFEAFEGMLVEATASTGDLTVSETYNLGRYGEFTVASDGRPMQFTQTNTPSATGYATHQDALAHRTLLIDDGITSQNPDPVVYPDGELSATNTLRSGYTIGSIKGCMNYSFGKFRIQPTQNITFNTTTNSREEIPANVGGDMKVASFNVLNYFNTFSGCTGGVNGTTMDCRGADNTEEFNRQREKIITALHTIDADVFGLMEIENDGYGGDSAIADLVNGLNSVAGSGTYAFVDADALTGTLNALGTDAIKVGFIYKRNSVALGKTFAAYLDNDNKNRPTLIQTFIHIATGDSVTLSVNHFKSKGSDCDALGDPNQNDGQGNCNITRTQAATTLLNVLSTEFPAAEKIMIMGDLNAYAKEDPIENIKSAGYDNLSQLFHGDNTYSYIYNGESGSLDHALSSAKLTQSVTGITEWHINTDEPKVLDYNTEYKSATQISQYYNTSAFRSSDHDPIIVGFNLDVVTSSSSSSESSSSNSSSSESSSSSSSSIGGGSSSSSSSSQSSNSSSSSSAPFEANDVCDGVNLGTVSSFFNSGSLTDSIQRDTDDVDYYSVTAAEDGVMTIIQKPRHSRWASLSIGSTCGVDDIYSRVNSKKKKKVSFDVTAGQTIYFWADTTGYVNTKVRPYRVTVSFSK